MSHTQLIISPRLKYTVNKNVNIVNVLLLMKPSSEEIAEFIDSVSCYSVADPGFPPGGGMNPPGATQFCQIFPETE